MRTAPVTEIAESIGTHRGSDPTAPRCAIAFDGDGTLWSGDIGEDFFAAVVASGRLLDAVHEPLIREAMTSDLDATGTAIDLARRIHAAYLDDRFPEERVCEVMTWAFAGWLRADMEAFARDVLDTVVLRERLHGEAMELVAWAREHHVDVFLVSASPRAVVAAAAAIVGIDPKNVVAATEQCSDDGRVLASVDRPIPYGDGKVTRLRALLGERKLAAAFGDNAFDVPMLRAAAIPVAIRPKPRLLDRAHEVPGLVVLERDR